jgi:peptidoglycan/LPS O-acetylase OafA/YrhL
MAQTGRYQNLDALRGIAALSVLAHHALRHVWSAMPDQTGWLQAVALDDFDLGRFGVVVFFLISGYVIPLSFSGPDPARKFVVSRFFRLYPAFWFAVLLMTAVLILNGEAPATRQVLANLTMVYPAFGEPALSIVYWTLLIELMFYGLALALFVMGALERPVVIGTIALVAIASAAIPIAANLAGASLPIRFGGYHLSFLLLGCLIRQSRHHLPHARAMTLVVLVAIAATQPLVAGLLSGPFAGYSLATPLGAMLPVAAAIAVFLLSWMDRFQLQGAAVLSLGAWSYSIYLLHEPLAALAARWLPPDHWASALAFLALVTSFTLALSAWVYRWIETPGINFGRAMTGHRAAAPAQSYP